MSCVFCEIVSGNLPARTVRETKEALAFLDIDPIQIGHVLIIPKRHRPDLTDMTGNELSEVMGLCQEIMKAIRHAYHPDSVTIIQSNGECMDVPHVHFHVVPRFTDDGFSWNEPDVDFSEKDKDEMAQQLIMML